MSRIEHYFGAGPAALPKPVLQAASEAVLAYENTGLSILELPHRSALFDGILEEANGLMKRLCGLDDSFEILWLQGGGRMQFAMVPMNALQPGRTAAYADTGHWAHDALETAQHYGDAQAVTSSREAQYRFVPPVPASLPTGTAYLHLTTNNTIYGTQYAALPTADAPLVADMSSDFLSRKLDFSACGLFYAVAQKNLGPAGVTLVAVRKDFLERMRSDLAPILSYKAHAAAHSVLNTPPVFAVYTSLLVLRWIAQEGLDTLEARNERKAATLYAELERNPLFQPLVEAPHRSRMNVVFRGRDAGVEQAFLQAATERGIGGIDGHRSVGGFRASLYNAVSEASVQELVAALRDFEARF